MTGAFSRKTSGISCALTVLRKNKEHRVNAVETPLGVTGLLFGQLLVANLLLIANLYQYWFPAHFFRRLIRTCFEQDPLVRSNLETDVNIA